MLEVFLLANRFHRVHNLQKRGKNGTWPDAVEWLVHGTKHDWHKREYTLSNVGNGWTVGR
jgi:hypothetical protein